MIMVQKEPNQRNTTLDYMRNEVPWEKERKTSKLRPLRTTKWLLEIDENIMSNFDGKRSERAIRLRVSKFFDQFFSYKTLVEKCQMFVQLLKM